MYCTYRIQNPITFICKAPHSCQCQRKLCAECQYEHGVDFQYTVPIKIFREQVTNILKETKLEETSEVSNQRMAFKFTISQTEAMLKKTQEELSESVKQIFDWIEKENQLYISLINENTNILETSSAEIEKLVSILEGKTLNDWNVQKNSVIMELEMAKNWWDQEIKAFVQKLNEVIKKIQSLFQTQSKKDKGGKNIFGANFDWNNLKIHELQKLDGHHDWVNSVCISPDGNTLASCSGVETLFVSDNSIRLWDLKTGQKIAKLVGHSKWVQSVCYSPDGTTLASCSRDKTILLWDAKTGQQLAKLDNHIKTVLSVCFSPDGATLASGSGDNSIYLWDVKTRKQKAQLNGHSKGILQVCFSPDGATLASCSGDKSIRLWDIKTGQQKAKLDGHMKTVMSVCFSPDGATLVSGSGDNSIRLWDVKTGQQKAKLDGHSNWVLSVCFSPDGAILASGSEDLSIRLWDVKTGQQKAKLDGHSNTVDSICFSPDGTMLASCSRDKSIRLWGAQWDK
ncbi:unnamed protein product [Paramecium sonneborni]|uniref:EML-like second beta-propeller domain-containing protein n=1 Tax=Paramecium sonneborni TaxID=65129 RepID=A0A8S1NP43_9CILI|nr:unnamed protein product [Paramecium sonneborni]